MEEALYRLVYNKYYVDELYEVLFVNSLKGLGTGLWKGFDEFIIDGTVNGIAYFIGWLSERHEKDADRVGSELCLFHDHRRSRSGRYYIVRSIFFELNPGFNPALFQRGRLFRSAQP